MKKIRFFIAMLAAKCSILLLKTLGRNASHLPGAIALKIDKNFLGGLTRPDTVIAITGTNGKTTVSNLLTSMLKANGYTVTNNSLGSNIQAGVTTALIEGANLSGKSKNQIAVLEVDERSSLRIYPYMQPDYLLCNNIMRDSLARNAHTEFISYIINEALSPDAKVILNADDLVCATLAPKNENRVYFGLDVGKDHEEAPLYLQDIVYCPQCGQLLEADYIRYNHIGRLHCTGCDFASPVPQFVLTRVDKESGTFTVAHDGKEETYRLINDNIVNLYNFCGLIALLTEFGLSYEQICTGFDQANIIKSRYDKLTAGDLTITMQLSKGENPTACARCFSYVAKCPGDCKAIIFVGDDFNPAESACWHYDSNFSYLCDPSINQVLFCGPNGPDQYLRALLAGVPAEKLQTVSQSTGGVDALDTTLSKDIYILYGPYMVKQAMQVKNKLIQLGEGGIAQ